jgi:hypothetical protein
MQIIMRKSLALKGYTLKSHHSHGDDHIQEKKNKRKLGSTPSPGGAIDGCQREYIQFYHPLLI